jgi:DNA-binding transcriptional LysR family regulator
MRQDLKELHHDLTGCLRIAVIPAALPMIATVTRGLFNSHPEINFTILSRPSNEIIPLLENLDIDAALTYLDVEPLMRVTTIPIYRERYQLLIAKESAFKRRNSITWANVARLPLCLLTTDTQNRHVIESLLRNAGGTPRISLESNSMTVLFAHVHTGLWASVMPEKIAQAMGMAKEFYAIPIVDPEVVHTIGLVMPLREPTTALVATLAAEARRVGAELMQSD